MAGLVTALFEQCGLRAEDITSNDPLDVAEVAKAKTPRLTTPLSTHCSVTVCSERTECSGGTICSRRLDFVSYVTLNFDSTLIDVLHHHKNVDYQEFPHLECQLHNKKMCFFIHGRIGRGQNAASADKVLTRTEFEQAYNTARGTLHSFLHQTFVAGDRKFCFLGCNPAEPRLRAILRMCSEHWSGDGADFINQPRKFLLWDRDTPKPDLSGTGVDLVQYPRGDEFRGFDDVLEYWAKTKPPRFRGRIERAGQFDAHAGPPR